MRNPVFTNGDRVAFAAAFCRSIMDFTVRGHMRGTVVGIGIEVRAGVNLILIDWDDGQHASVLSTNLVHADRIHLEPN
jgi:hypothetical protein